MPNDFTAKAFRLVTAHLAGVVGMLAVGLQVHATIVQSGEESNRDLYGVDGKPELAKALTILITLLEQNKKLKAADPKKYSHIADEGDNTLDHDHSSLTVRIRRMCKVFQNVKQSQQG